MKRKFNRKKGKNMERPNKETYGYVEPKEYDMVIHEPHYIIEGGEKLYNKAMKIWKEQEGRLCFETGIKDKMLSCTTYHLYSECK